MTKRRVAITLLLLLTATVARAQITVSRPSPPRATPPFACTASTIGWFYTDTDDTYSYRCDGTSWTTKAGSALLADTATALAANPSPCGSGLVVTDTAANGDLTCSPLTLASAQFANQGTTTTVAHGNAAGNPTWAAVSLAADVSGVLPVASGGTNLSSGTSGGILGYTASGTLASSVLLTASALVLGGGAGATPTPMGSLGTTTTLLHGNAAGAPTFGAVALAADVSGTLPFGNGGTGLSSASDDTVMVSSGSAWVAKALADCDDSGGNHVNYDTGTNAFSCGTSSSGGGGGSGDVVGPSSSVDNAIVRFDSTTGKLVQGYTSNPPTISDTGGMTIAPAVGVSPLRLYVASTYTAPGLDIYTEVAQTAAPWIRFMRQDDTEWGRIYSHGGGFSMCSGAVYGTPCSSNFRIPTGNQSEINSTYSVDVNTDRFRTTGQLTSTWATDLGWSVVAGANTACNTTCTFACVHGWDTAVTEVAVACTDATADKCLCAGAN